MKSPQDKEYQKIGKMIYQTSGYSSHNITTSLLWTFARGIVFGFGTFFGGTIMAALVIWFLAQLGEVPFLGELIESVQDSYSEVN